jgi:hypothetical protein
MSLGPLPSDSTKSSPTAAEEKIILGTTKPKLFPGAIAGILIAVFGASDPQFFSPHRTQSKIPSGLGHNHRSPFLLPLAAVLQPKTFRLHTLAFGRTKSILSKIQRRLADIYTVYYQGSKPAPGLRS